MTTIKPPSMKQQTIVYGKTRAVVAIVVVVATGLFVLACVSMPSIGWGPRDGAGGGSIASMIPPSGKQLRDNNNNNNKNNNNNNAVVTLADAGTNTATTTTTEDTKPGVHRYEITLARLLDDRNNNNDNNHNNNGNDHNDNHDNKGKIILETYDDWAPIGVSRFEELVTDQFYDDCRFFRVVNDFVVQFGINGDPTVQSKWRSRVLRDDPVVETNAYGTISYATSGPDTRTTQLFINTNRRGNGRLDGMGFAPIGRIVEGMDEYASLINPEYGEKPDQGKIQNRGNAYLDREFPRLSYIESIRRVGG